MDSNTIVRVYQDATEVLVPSAEFFTDELAEGADARDAAITAQGLAEDARDAAQGFANDAADSAVDATNNGAAQVALAADQVALAAAEAGDAASSAALAGSHEVAAGVIETNVEATEDAIQALIDGYPGSAGQTIPVATRAAMKAVSAPVGSFYLYESGREGEFVTVTWADVSADAANDTAEGYYVRSTADATKGFMRRTKIITPFHFGAVGDGSTNDLSALQAFCTFVFSAVRKEYADFSINTAISGTWTIGPAAIAPTNAKNWNIGGDIQVKQLTATFETLRLKNLFGTVWNGRIGVLGIGSTSFASRTCGVGIALENCGLMRIEGLRANNFWYAGIVTAVDSNDEMDLGTVRCVDCGSGSTGNSFTANWSLPSNSGSAGGVAQRTQLTLDVVPSTAIETYWAIGAQTSHVLINGKAHFVWGWDSVAKTVSIFPWIDSTIGSSGSLTWVMGGGVITRGSDANIIHFDHLQALRCGYGAALGSLYGARIDSMNAATCGIAVALGLLPNSSCIGNSIDAFYPEGNVIDVGVTTQFSAARYNYINSGYEIDLSKVWALGAARDGSNNLVNGELGTATTGPGLTLAYRGRILTFEKVNSLTGLSGTATFRGHTESPIVKTFQRDSHTILLTVQSTGSSVDGFHRLFGYTGGTWRYVGTGTNGAPTGSFTFTPPTQTYASSVTTSGSAVVTMPSTAGLVAGMPITGTGIPGSATILSVDSATQIHLSANATASGTVTTTVTGSVNGTFANVVFSAFDGPAEFSIDHTDLAQLIWSVRCVAGQIKTSLAGVDTQAAVNITLNTTTSKGTQRFDTALSTTKTVTLPAPGKAGRRFRIVRSANATGAGALNINTSSAVLVKALATSSLWADVEDDGTEYRLMATGAL